MKRPARAAVLGSLVVAGLLLFGTPLRAQQQNGAIYPQCPGDTNGDAIPDYPGIDTNNDKVGDKWATCMHLAGGDGFVTMADGKALYTFGFSDVTGLLPSQVVNGNGDRPGGLAAANYPAPTIHLKEGQEFYLSLTNVGMIMRPDLFDQHSVHFHGFPQAASVFDGVPESSATVNMGATFTYYYNIVDGLAGTYMYHCHVEATEHIQMGMVGNLYIDPRQNEIAAGSFPNGKSHAPVVRDPLTGQKTSGNQYVYNDGDGSTEFDVEYPIQLGSFDANFHEQHISIQPLPFAAMDDTHPTINGRGYPDTVSPTPISTDAGFGNLPSQPLSSLIRATAGQRVLLRLSNLGVTRFYTIGSTIPMRVVGQSARLLRGPDGKNLYYKTNSLTIGGGESYDVILDTTGVAPGTYLLYTTNLNYLSNDREDYGGMMTEITISGSGS
jgi:FtsP/CotA-like multicopper oxidase with cupredoxin domain